MFFEDISSTWSNVSTTQYLLDSKLSLQECGWKIHVSASVASRFAYCLMQNTAAKINAMVVQQYHSLYIVHKLKWCIYCIASPKPYHFITHYNSWWWMLWEFCFVFAACNAVFFPWIALAIVYQKRMCSVFRLFSHIFDISLFTKFAIFRHLFITIFKLLQRLHIG